MKKGRKFIVDYTDWTEAQHAEYLKTHEAYRKHLEKYDAEHRDQFIEEYARKKWEMYSEKNMYKSTYETHQSQFLLQADEYIDMILQKKLFNLQCQWRANDDWKIALEQAVRKFQQKKVVDILP